MVADPRCDVLPCAGNCGASVCRNDDCADDAHATAHLIGGRYYCPDCADGAELRWLRAESARLRDVLAEFYRRVDPSVRALVCFKHPDVMAYIARTVDAADRAAKEPR